MITHSNDAGTILASETLGTDQRLRLSARSTLQAVYESTQVPGIVRRNLDGALEDRFRNETTVEMAVRSPDLVPSWIAALLALDTKVSIVGKPQPIPLADLLGRTPTRYEPIGAVHIPVEVAGIVSGEAYLVRNHADAPIASAIAVTVLTEGSVRQARLALTGVWPEPARLANSVNFLLGGPLNVRYIREVAEAVEQEVRPHADPLGTAEYRRAMAGVLTYFALHECMRSARGQLSMDTSERTQHSPEMARDP